MGCATNALAFLQPLLCTKIVSKVCFFLGGGGGGGGGMGGERREGMLAGEGITPTILNLMAVCNYICRTRLTSMNTFSHILITQSE